MVHVCVILPWMHQMKCQTTQSASKKKFTHHRTVTIGYWLINIDCYCCFLQNKCIEPYQQHKWSKTIRKKHSFLRLNRQPGKMEKWKKTSPWNKRQGMSLYIKEIYKDIRKTVNTYKPTGRGNKVIISSISYWKYPPSFTIS